MDVRNGQYRASQTDVTGLRSTPRNEGCSGREGQPPGSSEIEVRLTPAGELGVREDASRLGSCRWGVNSDHTATQMNRLFRHCMGSRSTMDCGRHERQLLDRTEGASVGKWEPNGAGLYFGDGRRFSASGSPGVWSS